MNINPMVEVPKHKPIKRFKELLIDCNETDARAFFTTIIGHVRRMSSKAWVVDDKGMAMLEGSTFEKGLFCSIILLDTESKPYVDVTIKYDRDDSRIWLCNIVPCAISELTIDQYNDALDRFRVELVENCIGHLKCNVTKDSFVGSDVMSTETWKKLDAFSGLANRSSLHPYDNQRWHRFVISAFKNDPKLDGDTLGKILRLELGWSEDKTFQLVVRYEDEIALLKEYCGMPL